MTTNRRLKRFQVSDEILMSLINIDTRNWDYDISVSGLPKDSKIIDCYMDRINNPAGVITLIIHSESFEINDSPYYMLPSIDVEVTTHSWE